MEWIIDGHNLIPHVRGLSLADLDDEQALIDILIQFCRHERDRVVVFFDRAAPGHAGEYRFGAVRAIFVPQGQIADSAIAAFLRKNGSRLRDDTLVSSDRQVQASARALHLKVRSSDEFARKLQESFNPTTSPEPEKPLSEEEVRHWEELFRQHHTTQE